MGIGASLARKHDAQVSEATTVGEKEFKEHIDFFRFGTLNFNIFNLNIILLLLLILHRLSLRLCRSPI
jgi:hypothetical protein